MPNRNGEKGYRWEAASVKFINARLEKLGLEVKRQRQTGRNDEGDLGGLDLWAIECKDDASMSPQAMAEQARREADNSGKPFGVVVRKTRGKGPHGAVAVMTIQHWLDLVEYMETLRSEYKESI